MIGRTRNKRLNLAQRLYDGVSNSWFMFSSPILSNTPYPGDEAKGLPISYFLSYVSDTLNGLIDKIRNKDE